MNESVPFALPVLPGLKVTLMVQLTAGARVELQVLVSLKLGLAIMAVMLSVVVP